MLFEEYIGLTEWGSGWPSSLKVSPRSHQGCHSGALGLPKFVAAFHSSSEYCMDTLWACPSWYPALSVCLLLSVSTANCLSALLERMSAYDLRCTWNASDQVLASYISLNLRQTYKSKEGRLDFWHEASFCWRTLLLQTYFAFFHKHESWNLVAQKPTGNVKSCSNCKKQTYCCYFHFRFCLLWNLADKIDCPVTIIEWDVMPIWGNMSRFSHEKSIVKRSCCSLQVHYNKDSQGTAYLDYRTPSSSTYSPLWLLQYLASLFTSFRTYYNAALDVFHSICRFKN